MQLNDRQIRLLHELMKQEMFIPLNYFANKLDVSVKTLSRDLLVLDEILKEFDSIIYRKPNSGICLKMTDSNRSRLNLRLREISYSTNGKNITDINKRRDEILLYLLTNNLNINTTTEMAREFFVSKTVISDDIHEIQKSICKKHDVHIEGTRSGFIICGEEHKIRSLMSQIVLKYFPISVYITNDLLPVINSFESNYIQEMMRNIFDKSIKSKVDDLILKITSAGLRQGDSRQKHNLRISLFIQIFRMNNGKLVSLNETGQIYTENEFNNLMNTLTQLTNQNISAMEIYYSLANIETFLISIPEISNEKINSDDYYWFTSDCLDIFSTLTNLDFKQDVNYRNNFLIHVATTFSQKHTDSRYIGNPVLNNIRKQYSETYKIFKAISWILTKKYDLRLLNEDETTSLMIYLMSQLEKIERMLRVVILFDGSNSLQHMFMNKIQINFPFFEIEIVKEDYIKTIEKQRNFDLILSTLPFDITELLICDSNTPILTVSPIASEFDMKLIRNTADSIINVWKEEKEITRILNDLHDIGIKVKILNGSHFGDEKEFYEDCIVSSKFGFPYLLTKNNEINECEIVIIDQVIKKVTMNMKNWDYLLFSTKLIYIFENMTHEKLINAIEGWEY